MLGWAFKKGFQGATGLRDAPEAHGDDTAQFDAPDTPAPVFAARAIKNALWGQSNATNKDHSPTKAKSSDTQRVKSTASTTATTNTGNTAAAAAAAASEKDTENRSPNKLNSILLTPGTGTSRRKRVSFGQDVKADNNVDPSPFAANAARDGKLRKKTTLQKAMENARSTERKVAVEPRKEDLEADQTEEEWESDDENACCNHDVTVDLNDPHSESGKYWKAEWSRYREEAKSDIEQLVKYKVNARSFAAKKDTEAAQLAQKLKEEQAKISEMEKKMADMAAKLAATKKNGANEDYSALMLDLGKQTALATEYRDQVKALEARLKRASSEANANPAQQRINTSPRTEMSILEVSRELRKARSELRQLDQLRDEVKRLKSNLATSRERVAELETELETVASAEIASESSRVTKLEKQLRETKDESRHKDTEIRKLKRDFETLKRDALSRTSEAIQVLQSKNAQIDKLEKEIKDLKAVNISSRPRDIDAAITKHNRITQDLKSGIESLTKSSKYERTRPSQGRPRAASVQDITLDMTQRSLLGEKENQAEKSNGAGVLTDWTTEIPTLELQAPEQKAAEKQADKSILDRLDTFARRQVARSAKERPRQENDPDVLSNRVNGSSGVNARGNQQQQATDDAVPTDRNRANINRRQVNTQTTSLAEEKATAADRTARRPRTMPRTTQATAPSNNEAPAIDLVQDQFTRLGGPTAADRNGSGSTTRSSLTADRQAAALARLEQKRMERRKATGQDLDKENVRP
ncbi:hypothetical protein GGR50DRAFT_685870 [Xylaria sp. CBS 124048]|nr:hypothetical protein GGR50DRAFT_685870 [Xylaria sp. CBS 124048]